MVQSNETEARNTTSQTVSVRMTGEILQTIEQAAERKQLSVGQYLREAGYAAASRRRRPGDAGRGCCSGRGPRKDRSPRRHPLTSRPWLPRLQQSWAI